MSILCNRDTRLLVQGLGRAGQFHTQQIIAYGTRVVGGVHPRRAGETQHFSGRTDHSGVPGRPDTFAVDLPVFSGVREAVDATGANATLIFVPPPFAADSIMEAAEAGVELIVCITEGVPVNDMVTVKNYLASRASRLVGPNCPGVITPGECKLGIMPGYIHARGKVGVISRSGTLTYEAVYQLTNLGLGQTTALGIGGDPVNGTSFVDALAMFQADPATEGVLIIGGDRRTGRGGGGRLRSLGDDQAGGGVHRRANRTTRKAHGSCRGDHLRRPGDRPEQDRGLSAGRDRDRSHATRHGLGHAGGPAEIRAGN